MNPKIKDWLYGLMAAFIGGGASALTVGVGATLIDPDHFNLSTGMLHTLELVGGIFLVSGLTHVAAYLQKRPLPELLGSSSTETRETSVTDGLTVQKDTTVNVTVTKDAAAKVLLFALLIGAPVLQGQVPSCWDKNARPGYCALVVDTSVNLGVSATEPTKRLHVQSKKKRVTTKKHKYSITRSGDLGEHTNPTFSENELFFVRNAEWVPIEMPRFHTREDQIFCSGMDECFLPTPHTDYDVWRLTVNDVEMVKIKYNGDVIFGPNYIPNDAAREFWMFVGDVPKRLTQFERFYWRTVAQEIGL